mmetsp:Transcript_29101/g.73741  ORF Transcript_29101/g.73741 Transcript_29101/m.73741 type:complete len:87 (-) Transcript_29101:74-334(-)|eukprot:CAMPEP_0174926318 /NCGR_PEP_ID=MMETSP1355-20121228/11175_1 /TAXON_ID=464990 /ORGANISM="Hemiselmis tepida, Strain CCMP443" /LENGTH=86 /DNA_ID=CAMNT_0016172345 /DNA_START=13 /DNA_END=273 /DNA_ORIENTATION=-
MVLHMLAMKGLSGLVDDKWNWTPHDADWIIPDGPEGHLHEVYWNVYGDGKDALDDSKMVWAKPFDWEAKGSPFDTEDWQLKVNGIY